MKWRSILAIAIAIVGMIAPALVIAGIFGPDAKIAAHGPDSLSSLAVLAGCLVSGVIVGLVASIIARKSKQHSSLMAMVESILDAERSSRDFDDRHAHPRRAA